MKQWLCSIKNLCRCFNDIKILNLEKVFCDGLDIENKNLEQSTLKNNGFIKILTSINSFISQAMFFLTLLFGIVLIHYNRLTVGQLLGIAQASNMVIMPIVNYANLRNMIQSSNRFYKNCWIIQYALKRRNPLFLMNKFMTLRLSI